MEATTEKLIITTYNDIVTDRMKATNDGGGAISFILTYWMRHGHDGDLKSFWSHLESLLGLRRSGAAGEFWSHYLQSSGSSALDGDHLL